MRFRAEIRRHRRIAGIVYGLLAGFLVGLAMRAAGLSGPSLYLLWALSVIIVLAFVAPWALRGRGRRVPLAESSSAGFHLVRLWSSSELLLSFEEGEHELLDKDDFGFLSDSATYGPYVQVK